MDKEVKRISESIIDRLTEEKKENVSQYSLAKAEIRYENDEEVYWMIRNTIADPIVNTTITGDRILAGAGPPIHLPEKENEIVIERDGKFGALLLSGNIGNFRYKEPNNSEKDIIVHNLSKFDPDISGIIDAKNANIKTISETYNFQSIKEELKKRREIEELKYKSQIETDSERKIYLINEIDKKEKELVELTKRRKKHIISSSHLRDLPLLDEYQDKIKRTDFKNKNLIIEGGPGTGKTTSLIQRITFLTSPTIHEYINLNQSDLSLLNNRNKSWIFFSPSELLRQYLKNFMAKESLSPSDDNVLVWDDFKGILFRQFNLINTETQNPFQYSLNDKNIFDINSNSLKNISSDFEKHFVEYLKAKVNKILDLEFSNFGWKDFGDEILIELQKSKNFESIVKYIELFQTLNRKFTERSNQIIKRLNSDLSDKAAEIQLRLEKNENIKFEIYEILKEKFENSDASEEEQEEIADEDFDESDVIPTKDISIELNRILKNIIRKDSLLKIDKSVKLTSFEKRIFEKAVVFIKSIENSTLGELALYRKHFSGILRGFESNILNVFPRIYKSFRKNNLITFDIFINNGLKEMNENIKSGNKKVCKDEVDLILYLLFIFINKIYNNFTKLYNDSNHIYLSEYKDIVRCIVAIDEATDFSLLELSCMSYLSHPKFRSVSLSGDIMQRLQTKGIKSWDEYKSLYLNTEQHLIRISYRQTKYLLDIARKIYNKNTNDDLEIESAYETEEYDPKPLINKGSDLNKKLDWITKQILAINKAYQNKLPSIAILVNDNDTMNKIKDNLSRQEDLVGNGIKVSSCIDGSILGKANDVRIFEIKYIKGMEFQAVFFIDIDMLKVEEEDMLDRFLYVGVSRASFYLGITVNEELPERLNYLSDLFHEGSWG